jgi:hypothetical protein
MNEEDKAGAGAAIEAMRSGVAGKGTGHGILNPKP